MKKHAKHMEMFAMPQAAPEATSKANNVRKDDLSAENVSGELNIRIPKSLHLQLCLDAEREGISLEHYILYKLVQTAK